MAAPTRRASAANIHLSDLYPVSSRLSPAASVKSDSGSLLRMWLGLDPRIRTVWTVSSLVFPTVLLLVAAGLGIAGVPIASWIVGAIALVLIALALTVPAARWRAWGYQLTDTELIIRFGVVVKVRRWLPRTRIQHVDIVGGPIERALGLRQIVIYTAGTREADVTVPGLREADAERLRSDLLSWVESTAPESEVTEASAAPEADGSDGAGDEGVDDVVTPVSGTSEPSAGRHERGSDSEEHET